MENTIFPINKTTDNIYSLNNNFNMLSTTLPTVIVFGILISKIILPLRP